jgi:hypothetical protein
MRIGNHFIHEVIHEPLGREAKVNASGDLTSIVGPAATQVNREKLTCTVEAAGVERRSQSSALAIN